MTRIAVVPNHIQSVPGGADIRISLFEGRGPASSGSVGSGVVRRFLRTMQRSSAPVAWDMAALAMGVVASDRAVNRYRTSADGWTRTIELTVAVSDPQRWSATADRWASLLGFMTGDIWTIQFVGGGLQPHLPSRHAASQRPETCVSLLSGGLDSLIGSIDLMHAGETPVFVSNIVKGDRQKQFTFAQEVGRGRAKLLQLNHNVRTQGEPEISQRSRSLAFIAFGILAACSLDRYENGEEVTLHVPENGFISLNVPLTPLRIGSLSTRTTHPAFLRDLERLLNDLGIRVKLVNRYGQKTKGEMLAECADQVTLAALAPSSMSCGRGGRKYRHCGRCLPCLVRRGAFLRWTGDVAADTTWYEHPNNSPNPAADFAASDDVMQARKAVRLVAQKGVERWIGPSITSAHVDDVAVYRRVAEEGLLEIQEFLQAVGVQ